MASGLKENFVLPALYHHAVDGRTRVMLATHVDDIIWACSPGYEHIVEAITKELLLGKQSKGSFRFCGREFVQDPVSFETTQTCKATTEKLNKLSIESVQLVKGMIPKDMLGTPASRKEQADLMSGVGTMSWCVRMCRPGHTCVCSMLQSSVSKPVVGDLQTFNEAAAVLKGTSTRGIKYKKGVDWHNCVICAVSDAGHANAQEYIGEWDLMEPFRSQGGKLVFLASPEAVHEDEFHVVLVSFASNALKRVVRSTIQAEAYQLQQTVEEADIIRAALVDARGSLDRHDWETSAAIQVRSVWFTDCKSVQTALSKPIVRTVDKRLGIELASLRQQLWRFAGRDDIKARLQDGPPAKPTDVLRWVDTLVMLADPLTKPMGDELLQKVLDTGIWDVAQPLQGKEVKAKKAAQRQAKRAERYAEPGDDVSGSN